jgi:hypothetical protein
MIRWAAINGMLGWLDRGGPAVRTPAAPSTHPSNHI